MFGVDLGITVSSVSCVTGAGKVLDYSILFGEKGNKDEWGRVIAMSDAIVNSITSICKEHPGIVIRPYVTIEEPVYPYRTRNPRSYFNMSALYALTRNKLEKRFYKVYSVNPVSVKATAKGLAFKDKKLKAKYAVRGRLTKDGMIKAFAKVVGHEPKYSNKVGRETLADSYFIALAGLDRRKMGMTC